ncbi:hypothetical protein WJX84_007557 [Apatococcus fuscideae]|uniref:Uncharacterized protein n=1 Tax=Apatococcus fuscideae TaxID=2026836 RepID=A0AAW1SJY6_9CHLO
MHDFYLSSQPMARGSTSSAGATGIGPHCQQHYKGHGRQFWEDHQPRSSHHQREGVPYFLPFVPDAINPVSVLAS